MLLLRCFSSNDSNQLFCIANTKLISRELQHAVIKMMDDMIFSKKALFKSNESFALVFVTDSNVGEEIISAFSGKTRKYSTLGNDIVKQLFSYLFQTQVID